MGKSIMLNSTTEQSPFCIHCIGIGKAGCDMIAKMIEQGDIEDLLEDPRARFTTLAIDVGEKDLRHPKTRAIALHQRMKERGIPEERAQLRTYEIKIPEQEELLATLGRYREFRKIEFPSMYWNPNYEPWISEDDELPQAGDHLKRGMAKALYGYSYYMGGLKEEIEAFAHSVLSCKLPSLVFIFFGLSGGTGSGIVVDLARHLSNFQLGRRIPVSGFCFLPCEADDDCHKAADIFVALNELDCQIDPSKNVGCIGVWGEPQRDPWTGGMFLVPLEQAYERLRYHQMDDLRGNPRMERREENKFSVSRGWVDAGLASFISRDNGRQFFKSARYTMYQGSMSKPPSNERSFNMLVPYKEISPGVSVLKQKGHGPYKEEILECLDKLPEYMGLSEGFKTDYIEAYNYMPRDVYDDEIEQATVAAMKKLLIDDPDANCSVVFDVPYDYATSWTMFMIPGISKKELKCFFPARALYDAELDWDERLRMHSWLVDDGVMLCEPAIRYNGTAGECIWGCACHVAVPYAAVRGEADEAPSRRVIWAKAMINTMVEKSPAP